MVAVKYDEKVTDYAARVFAEQFCEYAPPEIVVYVLCIAFYFFSHLHVYRQIYRW